MAHKYDTTNRKESEILPGVSFLLRRMTEGRRIELRKKLGPTNAKIRELLREQGKLLEAPEDAQDHNRILELQDEFDGLMLEVVNPTTLLWGVKQIEGLEVDGKVLTLEDWLEWPSALFREILNAVNAEAELNGNEIKNSSSGSTSGRPEDGNPKLTTVASAGSTDIM